MNALAAIGMAVAVEQISSAVRAVCEARTCTAREAAEEWARDAHRALDGDGLDLRRWRKQMVRVAALAVAAIEWADRRHEQIVSAHRRAVAESEGREAPRERT